MDRNTVKGLRTEMQRALEILQENGFQVEVGNASFTEVDVTFKVKVTEGSSPEAAERAQFEKNAMIFGLSADDFGRVFTNGGRTFTLCGINPRAKRYPIQGRTPRGATYKFPLSVIS